MKKLIGKCSMVLGGLLMLAMVSAPIMATQVVRADGNDGLSAMEDASESEPDIIAVPVGTIFAQCQQKYKYVGGNPVKDGCLTSTMPKKYYCNASTNGGKCKADNTTKACDCK